MGATIESLTQSGYHIIDKDIIISANITIGAGSVLFFCGGKLIGPSFGCVTIKGDRINIIAAPVKIFDGEIDFNGIINIKICFRYCFPKVASSHLLGILLFAYNLNYLLSPGENNLDSYNVN